MHKSILIINQSCYPDQSGSGMYSWDCAQYLSKKGYEVSFLTERGSYLGSKVKYKKNEIIDSIKIMRIGAPFLGARSRLLRYVHTSLIYILWSYHLLICKKYDRVLVMSSPPLFHLFSAIVLRNTTKILWVLDIYPELAFRFGWINRSSLFGKTISRLNKWAVRQYKTIITLDKYMAKTLLEVGAIPSSVKVINLWSLLSSDLVEEREKNRSQVPIIKYSGNIGLCQPIDKVLRILSESQREFILYISDQKKNFAVKIPDSRFKSTEIVERNNLREYLTEADFHLIVVDQRCAGVMHPSKFYNILDSKRPFLYIGPKESFIADILKHNRIGEMAESEDKNKLFQSFEYLLDNSDKYELNQSFSKEEALSSIEKEIESCKP